MQLIKTVAKALPNMQFIFTSQSPLVARSLESMNIITLQVNSTANSVVARRLKQSIHGLNADEVLRSGYFRVK